MSGQEPDGPLTIGWRRLAALPRVVVWTYLASVGLALPLAAAMGEILSAAIGPSVAGERLVAGFDHLWFRGFAANAEGLAATFDPSLTGIGAVAKSLDTLVRGALLDLHPAVFAVGVLYLLLWVFVSGGVLHRFVGQTSDAKPRGFMSTSAAHFPRLLALAAIGVVLHAFIFRFVLSGLSDAVDSLTYDLVDERIHFAYVLGKYAVVWGLVWTVSLLVDYAKMAAVRDPTASLTSCVFQARRLLGARTRAVYGLSAALVGLGVVLVLGYAVIAPGAGQHNGFNVAIAFAISQLYVLGRIALRVLGLGAQAALFAPPEALPATAETTASPVG